MLTRYLWIALGILILHTGCSIGLFNPSSPEQLEADHDQEVKERTDYIMEEIRCKDLRQPGC